MPLRFRVYLIPEKVLPISEFTPDRLHGIFFSLLSNNLAEEIHSSNGVKPFSLNFLISFQGKKQPLFGAGFETVDRIILEISFLDEGLFPRFLSSYLLEDKEIKLGDVRLKKLKRPQIREKDLISYENLFSSAEPNRRVELRFLSPTTFRRGNLDHPLPDPDLIFKGLIRKWQRFSDLKIDVDLREVIKHRIAVAGAWVGTRRVHLSGFGWIVGFTGRVILSFEERDERVLKWLNTLIRFGEFAGVGRKTTMGFGVIRLKDMKLQEEGNPPVEGEAEESASNDIIEG